MTAGDGRWTQETDAYSGLPAEALAWVATVERLLVAKGVSFDSEIAAGLGCMLVLHARVLALGSRDMAPLVAPVAAYLGLTLRELEAAGPTGVA
jgi:hypothetical protein